MSRILLIRHGQASFMKSNYDELSELGREQSVKLGHWMRANGIEPVSSYTGSLHRQLDTCSLSLGDTLTPKIDVSFNEHEGPAVFKDHLPTYLAEKPQLASALKEKGMQDPEVRPQLVKAFFQMHHMWTKGHIDSGRHESWSDFKQRATTAYELIMGVANKGTVVVYTSGGLIAAVLGCILDLKDDKIVDINWQIKNTSITELKLSSGRLHLSVFNATPHLTKEEVTFV